jgi:hypothetical protein
MLLTLQHALSGPTVKKGKIRYKAAVSRLCPQNKELIYTAFLALPLIHQC